MYDERTILTLWGAVCAQCGNPAACHAQPANEQLCFLWRMAMILACLKAGNMPAVAGCLGPTYFEQHADSPV
jgi:hypothetical protein